MQPRHSLQRSMEQYHLRHSQRILTLAHMGQGRVKAAVSRPWLLQVSPAY